MGTMNLASPSSTKGSRGAEAPVMSTNNAFPLESRAIAPPLLVVARRVLVGGATPCVTHSWPCRKWARSAGCQPAGVVLLLKVPSHRIRYVRCTGDDEVTILMR